MQMASKWCSIPIIYYQLQPLKTLYMVTGPFRIQVFACEKSSAIPELLAQLLGLSASPNAFDDNLGSQTKHILQKKTSETIADGCKTLRNTNFGLLRLNT